MYKTRNAETYHTHQEELDHNNLGLHMLRLFFQNWCLHDTMMKPYC